MNSLAIFTNASLLFCGLSLFLYGMQHGEKYLRKIGGQDLKRVISIITRNRLSAYIAGLVMTLTTQSSSATTVMLVGLVSSGFMTIGQSLGMVLGSDLGTTITVQLFAIKFQKLAPLFIALGFLISKAAKKEILKEYGKLLLSLGLIFFGMQIMADAIVPLQMHPYVHTIFYDSFSNPFLALFAGALLTAIIQSSAATLAIIMSLTVAMGSNNPETMQNLDLFPIIMGANLGTCSTAFLSMLGANTSGVRVAWAHFLFKLIGICIFFPLNYIIPFSDLIHSMAIPLKIAVLHTFFNGCISVIFLPFTASFEKILIYVVPDKKNEEKYRLEFIGTANPSIPSIALSQSLKEIMRMAEYITHMLEKSKELLDTFDQSTVNSIEEYERRVDFLRSNIISFLIRISREELETVQAKKAYELVMITTDLENLADIINRRITVLVIKIKSGATPLSDDGKGELLQFYSQTINRFKEVSAALVLQDIELARSIFEYKDGTGTTYMNLFEQHLERLYNKTPESIQTTSVHVDLLDEIRRINHYTCRIAAHALRMANDIREKNHFVRSGDASL